MGIHKKNIVFLRQFFYFFCLVYIKWLILDIYESLNISIVTVMKNPEMLKFVPDHLKTKKNV